MAAINSLGIGSGVLTSDIIDQLRAVDESNIIKPLENKITLANQKEDAYKLLSSLMTTFKTSAYTLDGDNLYLARSVTGNTDALTVTAEAGADVQSFNITNIDKAEKDVWNSGVISDTTVAFQTAAGTLDIGIGIDTFTINYTVASTLDEIRDSINNTAGAKVTASILEVGANQFELVITADNVNEFITFNDSNAAVQQVDTVTLADTALADGDEFSLTINGFTANYVASVTGGDDINTVNDALKALMDAHDFGSGAGNDFTISASVGSVQTITAQTAGTSFTSSATVVNDPSASATMSSVHTTANLYQALNLNNIQVAEAATFDYNGISITRSTNEISDLINGVTLTLNQNQAVGDSANIKIAQNDTSISSEMSIFVNSYNNLITNLQDMTKSSRETGAVGIFQGESFVKSISRELSALIFQVDDSGKSLVDYGIDVDRYGIMSLDVDVFANKFVTEPEAMELFFSGNATTDGVFTKLNDKMNEYTGYKKLLSNFSDQLDDRKDALVSQYDKLKASLDSRYEIMTKRFIAYDAMISRINFQFSSLQMMIDAEANKNN
ncbi:MAG: flagellar filament capping protein FliD [Sulfurimonas sp.]|nr:flagellar filament capping protein FliD [Sulfurimonas sp.]